jgi:hypothetical protein
LLIIVSMTSVACKKEENRTPLNPSMPPAGLDTGQKQLTDGAGNPGPVRARLLSVRPSLNATVVGTPAGVEGRCGESGAGCFEFSAEFCMDAVSNPNNSVLLARMRVTGTFSPDGSTPILRNGSPVPYGLFNPVTPGTCQSFTTNPNMRPTFPAEATPRFFMLVAYYGTGPMNGINQAACPTPEAIVTNNITLPQDCAFRVVYDLGYHF